MNEGEVTEVVKFSTWREASHAQANGPVRTMRQAASSSSGTSGIGRAAGSSATHTMPYRSHVAYTSVRARAGTRVGSASCGIRVQAPSAP